MTEAGYILTIIFVLLGTFFMFIGSIGVVRLPDFYTRSHATSKSDTLGIMLIITGLIFYEGLDLNSLKLIIVFIIVAVANPVGAHALSRAAFKFGVKPWFKKKREDKT